MKPKVSCIVLVVLLLTVPALFAQLVNPNASLETRQLKTCLDSVYGKRIIAGQMDDGYLSNIRQHTGGKSPALMGYDLNGICPTQAGNHDAEKAINWVKNDGGIAQFQWHWISPNGDGDFYTKNFNLATLINGERQPGVQCITFSGQTLAAGVYYCRLTVTAAGKTIESTKKLILLR